MEEHIEVFNNITLRTLRLKYEQHQNFNLTPNWIKKRFVSGKFRRVQSHSHPTVIKLADGGILGYRVPATLINETLAHIQPLEQWVTKFSDQLPKYYDNKRGLECVRKYIRWIKYDKDRHLKLSHDYHSDGEATQEFFKQSDLLWKLAQAWFPQHYHKRIYRDMSMCPLKEDEQPLCRMWMGCAVNLSVNGNPVETLPHRDVLGFKHGMSCLCPFGEFTGGALVLWELQAIIELKRGDLFFFMDHLINHSNERAYGSRHSVVAFTPDLVWNWLQAKFNFKDARREPLRTAQKRFREEREVRKVKKARQDSN